MYEFGLEGATCVATPGVKVNMQQLEADAGLEARTPSPVRAMAAKTNYLSAGRVDITFATEEICRFMSSPTGLSVAALQGLGRYLEGHGRFVHEYLLQDVSHVEVYSDIGRAGCPTIRKPTSGGCTMLGGHLTKSWSSTQPELLEHILSLKSRP